MFLKGELTFMYAIVAVDYDWAIGNQGKLLYRVKEDMRRFKMRTLHNIVVMGRKTFESLPGQKPLKDRINIVLTRQNITYDFDNVIVMHSVEEVLDYCKGKEAYCIGGEEIYRLFLPYCDRAYVTLIYDHAKEADAYFPDIHKDPYWGVLYDTETYEENGIYYRFKVYTQDISRS